MQYASAVCSQAHRGAGGALPSTRNASSWPPFSIGNAVNHCEAGSGGGHHNVEPRFDAEITYAEITTDGMVRQPAFKALLSCRSI